MATTTEEPGRGSSQSRMSWSPKHVITGIVVLVVMALGAGFATRLGQKQALRSNGVSPTILDSPLLESPSGGGSNPPPVTIGSSPLATRCPSPAIPNKTLTAEVQALLTALQQCWTDQDLNGLGRYVVEPGEGLDLSSPFPGGQGVIRVVRACPTGGDTVGYDYTVAGGSLMYSWATIGSEALPQLLSLPTAGNPETSPTCSVG